MAGKRLSDWMDLGLELKDIMGCYVVPWKSLTTFEANSDLHMITGLSGSNRRYNKDHMIVTGNWRPAQTNIRIPRRPSHIPFYPNFPPADHEKVMRMMNHWAGRRKDLDARSAFCIMGVPYPAGFAASPPVKMREWSLDQVQAALASIVTSRSRHITGFADMFSSEDPSPVRVGPSVAHAKGSTSQTKRHRLRRAVEGSRSGVAGADDGKVGQTGESVDSTRMAFGSPGPVEGASAVS